MLTPQAARSPHMKDIRSIAAKDATPLHHVVALEGLLGDGHGDLARKVGQCAAILAAINVAGRLGIRRVVSAVDVSHWMHREPN
jgi:hypothetical protein